MKHAHNNLNNEDCDPNEISDFQLDQLLGRSPVPPMERKRRSRIKRQLNSLLRRGDWIGLTINSPWTRAAIGMVAVCGLMLMVSAFSNHPGPVIEFDASPLANANHLETKAYPTISHVVWVPVSQPQPRPISTELNRPFTWLHDTVEHVMDSEIGLTLLEQANQIVQSESRNAQQSRDRRLIRYWLPLQRQWSEYESQLVREIRSPASSYQDRTLAFRKLCHVGTERTQSFVLKHWQLEELRPEIVLSASRLADSGTLAQLVASTNDVDLQFSLMKELLSRGDGSSVELFLKLTERHRLHLVAQSVGRQARRLPRTKLLAAISSHDPKIVRAAAITISSVNDPEITQSLFEMAQRPETTRSALLALTASHDEQAARFLRVAANDVQWSATVASVQRKWNRLMVPN